MDGWKEGRKDGWMENTHTRFNYTNCSNRYIDIGIIFIRKRPNVPLTGVDLRLTAHWACIYTASHCTVHKNNKNMLSAVLNKTKLTERF